MPVDGNESGLFWQCYDAVKLSAAQKKKTAATPVMRPQLAVPPSTWRPVQEFPDLRLATRIGFDIETKDPLLKEAGCGARRTDTRIVGFSLAIEGGPQYYYPIRHEGGDNLPEEAVLAWAREAFGSFAGEVVGANILYDLDFLETQEGIAFKRVRRIRDVQIAEPLLDENARSYSLATLARKYGLGGKEEGLLRNAAAAYGVDPKAGLWQLPARYVGAYAQGDADLPLRILRKQEVLLAQENLLDLFDMESRLTPVLLAMRRRGVRIDADRAELVKRALQDKLDEAVAAVRHIAGTDKVEPHNARTFAHILQERGFHLPKTAQTGEVSVTKPWLEANDHDPFVSKILAARKLDKVIGTFINGHILGHAVKGRIHCSFHQVKGSTNGATTGRLSSSNPNLQNLPSRDEEIAPLIRSIFMPEDGEEWVRGDYSQIEYRFLAHYAMGEGADDVRAAYCENPKTDFHKKCALMAGMDPNDSFTRKRVKNVNFGVVYGAGDRTTAATMGVSLDEAQAFLKIYHDALPFVRHTSNKAMQRAAQVGYVKTILGRYRRFNLWEPKEHTARAAATPLPLAAAKERWPKEMIQRAFTYAALNAVLQGSAADQMKKAMVDYWEAGLQDVLGPPLVTVHDELDVSSPRTAAGGEAVRALKDIMERAIPLKVPVIAEFESGPNWGDCK